MLDSKRELFSVSDVDMSLEVAVDPRNPDGAKGRSGTLTCHSAWYLSALWQGRNKCICDARPFNGVRISSRVISSGAPSEERVELGRDLCVAVSAWPHAASSG